MLLDAPVLPRCTAMLAAWQAHRAAIGAVPAVYPQTPPRSVAGHPALKMRTHRISPLSNELYAARRGSARLAIARRSSASHLQDGILCCTGAVAISGTTRRSILLPVLTLHFVINWFHKHHDFFRYFSTKKKRQDANMASCVKEWGMFICNEILTIRPIV